MVFCPFLISETGLIYFTQAPPPTTNVKTPSMPIKTVHWPVMPPTTVNAPTTTTVTTTGTTTGTMRLPTKTGPTISTQCITSAWVSKVSTPKQNQNPNSKSNEKKGKEKSKLQDMIDRLYDDQ